MTPFTGGGGVKLISAWRWIKENKGNRHFPKSLHCPQNNGSKSRLSIIDIVMHFLLSFISSLDFKPLFMPIEGNSGSVYRVRSHCFYPPMLDKNNGLKIRGEADFF